MYFKLEEQDQNKTYYNCKNTRAQIVFYIAGEVVDRPNKTQLRYADVIHKSHKSHATQTTQNMTQKRGK
jgi:hypothetical protein